MSARYEFQSPVDRTRVQLEFKAKECMARASWQISTGKQDSYQRAHRHEQEISRAGATKAFVEGAL